MEIDFSDLQLKNPTSLMYVTVFLTLLALGALGWWLTPQHDAEPGFLTWTEWQIFKGANAYQRELARLQQETDALADMLTEAPEPVRAQLLATRLSRDLATGEPALAYARDLLLQAALSVQAWAVGADTLEAAQQAVAQSGRALEALTIPVVTSPVQPPAQRKATPIPTP